MPWHGGQRPGDVPTLGWDVADWIEESCVVPDGDKSGQPYMLTNEMRVFLAHHYRLKPNATPGQKSAAFFYRRSQLVRPQKWGKGPLSAAMICAESVGPALFDGWDADGEPVGRPWSTPLIQVTARSEDQAANVYSALVPMIQLGPLADVIPDTGDTRINLPGGGRIDPVTSKADSRLGQRVSFAVQDETGIWLASNGGQKLSVNQRRGLAGMSGRAVETTNAWDPSESSVAQQTSESTVTDVYKDHTLAPAGLNYMVKADRYRIHRIVYGDSIIAKGGWVDLDAINAEADEIVQSDPANAERFFGNRVVQAAGAWITDELWLNSLRNVSPFAA